MTTTTLKRTPSTRATAKPKTSARSRSKGNAMTRVSFVMDDVVKSNADALFSRLGMDMPTAVTIFIHQTLRHNGLPFEVKADKEEAVSSDPYFNNPKNLAFLYQAVADYEAGRNFTEHELIELEDDE